METMLLKMARQLNAMDEASLMSLWDKYMAKVQYFDGSKEWEEAAIVLALIQAVKGKNQLFNAHMQNRLEKRGGSATCQTRSERTDFFSGKSPQAKTCRKILPFRPKP